MIDFYCPRKKRNSNNVRGAALFEALENPGATGCSADLWSLNNICQLHMSVILCSAWTELHCWCRIPEARNLLEPPRWSEFSVCCVSSKILQNLNIARKKLIMEAPVWKKAETDMDKRLLLKCISTKVHCKSVPLCRDVTGSVHQ